MPYIEDINRYVDSSVPETDVSHCLQISPHTSGYLSWSRLILSVHQNSDDLAAYLDGRTAKWANPHFVLSEINTFLYFYLVFYTAETLFSGNILHL